MNDVEKSFDDDDRQLRLTLDEQLNDLRVRLALRDDEDRRLRMTLTEQQQEIEELKRLNMEKAIDVGKMMEKVALLEQERDTYNKAAELFERQRDEARKEVERLKAELAKAQAESTLRLIKLNCSDELLKEAYEDKDKLKAKYVERDKTATEAYTREATAEKFAAELNEVDRLREGLRRLYEAHDCERRIDTLENLCSEMPKGSIPNSEEELEFLREVAALLEGKK